MGYKYMLMAAKYPFGRCYNASASCRTLFGVLIEYIKMRIKKYDIIDIKCRLTKEEK